MAKRYGARMAGLLVAVGAALLGACSGGTGPEKVAALDIVQDSLHLGVGSSGPLELRILGPGGESLDDRLSRVEWESDDTQVTTVERTATGAEVTATGVGSAVVRAHLADLSVPVPVYVHPAGLASIAIDPPSFDLVGSQTAVARAVLRDDVGDELSPEGFRISWKIGNARVASIRSATNTEPEVVLGVVFQGDTELTLIVGDRTAVAPVTASQSN